MTYSVPGPIRTNIVSSTFVGGGDSPFTRTRAVMDMVRGWEIMKAVSQGTEYLRANSEAFLPLEPREDYEAYLSRVNRAVFSPYTQRLIRAATGLILRKPITIVGDPYWTDVFVKDVDGCGSDLDEYARRLLICALTYGHSHSLVDFPAPTGAKSLAEEREQNRRPYWIEIDPTDIYGWRLDREVNYGKLIQVRIAEKAVVPSGEFGEKVFDQVRVIEPGEYRIYRKKEAKKDLIDVEGSAYAGNFDSAANENDYELVSGGDFSLGEVPLVTVYAGKTDTMTSKPPLLDIAYLNLAHFQRQADLIHSLHVASQPMLVLEGWDDQTKDMAISVNYAMATQPGNKVYYVEPASSAFEAQSAEIQELQLQMATLGISTLSQQKFVAESADARRLDRVDTNSMLSMVSLDLEQKIQKSFDLSAKYLGLEPPEIKISRDFDIDRLIGQDITALTSLFDQSVIDREEFRDILVQGEVLPAATEKGKGDVSETPVEVKEEGATSDQINKLIESLNQ